MYCYLYAKCDINIDKNEYKQKSQDLKIFMVILKYNVMISY